MQEKPSKLTLQQEVVMSYRFLFAVVGVVALCSNSRAQCDPPSTVPSYNSVQFVKSTDLYFTTQAMSSGATITFLQPISSGPGYGHRYYFVNDGSTENDYYMAQVMYFLQHKTDASHSSLGLRIWFDNSCATNVYIPIKGTEIEQVDP
jgi:hypothetical protein